MSKPPLGVFYDMPFDDYHAVDAISNSAMKHLARSPWHYRNRVPVTPTKAMVNGSLVHCAQLEPHALAMRYVVVPEDAPRKPSKTQLGAKKPSPETIEAIEWWSEFGRANVSRTIISANDYATVGAQLAAIQAEPELARIFAKGRAEVSLFWTDRRTGVYCKARLDWLHTLPDGRLCIADLKSAADDTPDGFSRSVGSMGYHRQQAHYTAGAVEVLGAEVADFLFPVVSSAAPILATPYRLDAEAAQQGFDEVAELLDLYADCRRRNHWPAYTAGERLIGLPAWKRRYEEVEVETA